MRYEIRHSTIPHPYRRNRFGTPLHANAVGIWDREEQNWVSDPAMGKADYARVRELNGLDPLTTAKVRAVLKKGGAYIAKWNRSGMVRGWGSWTSGANVEQGDDGRIFVHHQEGHWSKMDDAGYAEREEKYANILIAAGIAVTEDDKHKVIV